MSIQYEATNGASGTLFPSPPKARVFRSPPRALATACKSTCNGSQAASSGRRPRRREWPECADARADVLGY
eukprot:12442475-Alexandrium_andersonii.AAC.1